MDNKAEQTKQSTTNYVPPSVEFVAGCSHDTSSTSPQNSSPTKKSARLAEKRKLREEAGPITSQDDEFYFTPLKICRLSSPVTVKNEITTANSKITLNSTSSNDTGVVKNEVSDASSNQGILITATPTEESSEEEEKWFDCFDGKLDDDIVDIDEISTSGRFLTERQKSIIFKKDTGYSIDESSNVQLPKELAYNNSVRTKKEKSDRRRVLAQQKKEYDKKRTVDRLLKKQPHPFHTTTSKLFKGPIKSKHSKIAGPMITYIIGRDSNSISFPIGIDISVFDGSALKTKPSNFFKLQDPIKCGVDGCQKLKKYTCSKTNIPICSLKCYKKNLHE